MTELDRRYFVEARTTTSRDSVNNVSLAVFGRFCNEIDREHRPEFVAALRHITTAAVEAGIASQQGEEEMVWLDETTAREITNAALRPQRAVSEQMSEEVTIHSLLVKPYQSAATRGFLLGRHDIILGKDTSIKASYSSEFDGRVLQTAVDDTLLEMVPTPRETIGRKMARFIGRA